MKLTTQPTTVAVSTCIALQFDVRELAFLRRMAEHCITTDMMGHGACHKLVRALEQAGIPTYDQGPIYGLFEAQR